MATTIWANLMAVAALAAGCSPAPRGRIVVAITIDWEGAVPVAGRAGCAR
jgi:hypothetical protein